MTIKQIVTVIMCAMLLLTLVLTAVVIWKVSPVLNVLLGVSDVTPPDDSSLGSEMDDNNQEQDQNDPNGDSSQNDPNGDASQNDPNGDASQNDSNGDASQNNPNGDGETPHEHAYDILKRQVAATCEKSGHKIYTCECGKEKVEAIQATGHKYGVGKLISPTCKEEGRTEFVCETCGYVDARDVTEKLADHVWEKGETYPATCTEDGYTEYACSCRDCDETKTVAGEKAKGHAWVEVENHPANCTEGAYTDYACSRQNCDETKRESGEKALGHEAGEWELNSDPALDVRGEEVKKCVRCSVVLESRSQGMTMTVQKNDNVYTVNLISKNKAEEDVVVFVYTITDQGALLSEESFVYTDVEGMSLVYNVGEDIKVYSMELCSCEMTINDGGEVTTPDAE